MQRPRRQDLIVGTAGERPAARHASPTNLQRWPGPHGGCCVDEPSQAFGKACNARHTVPNAHSRRRRRPRVEACVKPAACDTSRHAPSLPAHAVSWHAMTRFALTATCMPCTKRKRPCASLHTAASKTPAWRTQRMRPLRIQLNRTRRARCGTSAARATPHPIPPDANSGSPCAGCARDAASGWWRGHRYWSGR